MDNPQMSGPITTADSKAEGRLIVGAGNQKCSHGKTGKCLKCSIKDYKKDGKGGPGNMLPSGMNSVTDTSAIAPSTPPVPSATPGMGIQPTAGSYSPQQMMQMAASGVAPVGQSSSQSVAPGSVGLPRTTASGASIPPRFATMGNRPHRKGGGARGNMLKGMKVAKMKSLKAAVKASSKPRKIF